MYRVLYLLLFCIGILFFPLQATGQQVALKTNVLFWATTPPNAGVEFGVGRRFTIDLWGAYNAWKFPNDMKLNLYLVQPEVRFWPFAVSSRETFWGYTDITAISISVKSLLSPA